MSLDPDGLRRRSPNPNSPIPYSPALLSPYLAQPYEWTSARSRHGEYSAAPPASTPTIRLVGPSSAASPSSYYVPPPSRTQSDDRHVRGTQTGTNLRRHGTDPTLYPTQGRRYRPFEPAHLHRPVPTLPLNIRREQSRSSSFSRASSPSTVPSLAPSPSTTGRSLVDSLRGLSNPFRRPVHPPSPSLSVESGHSGRSFRSSSSRSSTETLVSPFSKDTLWKVYSGVPDQSKASASMEKLRAAGVAEKITNKFPGKPDTAKEQWTGYKVLLLFSIFSVFGYGLAGLIWALTIWLKIRPKSDVTIVSDPDVVIFLTLASLLCMFSAMVGLTGVLLNSRPILAFYNLLLWPTLLSMCLVGYTSYKRENRQLERKLNQAWSQFLDDEQRLRIQNTLKCCGYFNPLHDATYSKNCYPRTELPGCKGRWMLFQQATLSLFATAAFGTIPFHFVNITIAILCSNHVNKTFGKGLTPAHYRLRMADVKANTLAVLASIPPAQKNGPYRGQPSVGLKRQRRSDSALSMSTIDSRDTLTHAPDTRRTRSRQSWVGEIIRGGGPRARTLKEARDRGMI